ncbi:hypothetical protein N7528_000638 [Penicillium herquei]|nr:hypothetical protein N7528_000638 [Penicillium herquei]
MRFFYATFICLFGTALAFPVPGPGTQALSERGSGSGSSSQDSDSSNPGLVIDLADGVKSAVTHVDDVVV